MENRVLYSICYFCSITVFLFFFTCKFDWMIFLILQYTFFFVREMTSTCLGRGGEGRAKLIRMFCYSVLYGGCHLFSDHKFVSIIEVVLNNGLPIQVSMLSHVWEKWVSFKGKCFRTYRGFTYSAVYIYNTYL